MYYVARNHKNGSRAIPTASLLSTDLTVSRIPFVQRRQGDEPLAFKSVPLFLRPTEIFQTLPWLSHRKLHGPKRILESPTSIYVSNDDETPGKFDWLLSSHVLYTHESSVHLRMYNTNTHATSGFENADLDRKTFFFFFFFFFFQLVDKLFINSPITKPSIRAILNYRESYRMYTPSFLPPLHFKRERVFQRVTIKPNIDKLTRIQWSYATWNSR